MRTASRRTSSVKNLTSRWTLSAALHPRQPRVLVSRKDLWRARHYAFAYYLRPAPFAKLRRPDAKVFTLLEST